jgi:hypothetical protein
LIGWAARPVVAAVRRLLLAYLQSVLALPAWQPERMIVAQLIPYVGLGVPIVLLLPRHRLQTALGYFELPL